MLNRDSSSRRCCDTSALIVAGDGVCIKFGLPQPAGPGPPEVAPGFPPPPDAEPNKADPPAELLLCPAMTGDGTFGDMFAGME